MLHGLWVATQPLPSTPQGRGPPGAKVEGMLKHGMGLHIVSWSTFWAVGKQMRCISRCGKAVVSRRGHQKTDDFGCVCVLVCMCVSVASQRLKA